MVFRVFSGSLLLSAVLGPAVGRAIDNRGGPRVRAVEPGARRRVGPPRRRSGHCRPGGAWAVLGVGMALGLYDSAFATLSGLYGRAARGPITGITLIAGFASTVGWPLSAFLDASVGWRGACLVWAALNLLVGLPLNRLLIRVRRRRHVWPRRKPRDPGSARRDANSSVRVRCDLVRHRRHGGASARLLEIAGASSTAAIAAAALVGPAQVGARLVEFSALRSMHPLVSARIATVCIRSALSRWPRVGPAAITAFALFSWGRESAC